MGAVAPMAATAKWLLRQQLHNGGGSSDCPMAAAERWWQWWRLCDGSGRGDCVTAAASQQWQQWQQCNGGNCMMATAAVTAAVAATVRRQCWRRQLSTTLRKITWWPET